LFEGGLGGLAKSQWEVRVIKCVFIEMSGWGVLIGERSPFFSRKGIWAGRGIVPDSSGSLAGVGYDTLAIKELGEMYACRFGGGGVEASSTS
jgi:hypothetical protein